MAAAPQLHRRKRARPPPSTLPAGSAVRRAAPPKHHGKVRPPFPATSSQPDPAERLSRSDLASARADALCRALLGDSSALALRPAEAEELLELCQIVMGTSDSVHAPATLKVDDKAWVRWTDYCKSLRTPPLRDEVGVVDMSLHRRREAVLLAGFFLYCKRIIKPKSHRRNTESKPQSAMNMVRAVVRIHKRLGLEISGGPLLQRTFIATCRAYVREHGAEALVPARKEPLDGDRVRRILQIINGTKCGRRKVDWAAPFFICIKAMMCTMLSAGFRKAEVALPDGESIDARRLLRSSISWKIRGVLTSTPSDQELRSLTQGDFCIIKPPLMKNDSLGEHFSWRPIYLPVDGDAVNAARAIADMFLAVPIPTSAASSTLLFCTSTAGSPMRHSTADSALRGLLVAAFPSEDPSRWSWHSFRIGCACALLAAGASMPLIQAIARWRSTQSIEIYARLGAKDYGTWVLRVQKQAVDVSTVRNLPRLDSDGVVALMMAQHADT